MKLISILAIIALLLMTTACSALWKTAMLPVKTVTNQVDSASEIVDKTYDADNAIYNYEWFKTQHEKIIANRQQITNTKTQIDEFKNTFGNVTSWDSDTKQEYNRLNTIKLGLINQDENLVADYNARAKMANRAVFQDKLPLYVDRILW